MKKSFITSGPGLGPKCLKVYQQKILVDKEITKINVFLNFGAEIYEPQHVISNNVAF